MEKERPLILFDGVCNLCNTAVQVILKWEKNSDFQFASIQSSLGQKLIAQYQLEKFDSIIIIEKGEAHIEAQAALRMLKNLKFPFSLFRVLNLLPIRFNNWGYRKIAQNRYQIFGKKEHCMLPDKRYLDRFLG